jgi:hypothetical protein
LRGLSCTSGSFLERLDGEELGDFGLEGLGDVFRASNRLGLVFAALEVTDGLVVNANGVGEFLPGQAACGTVPLLD